MFTTVLRRSFVILSAVLPMLLAPVALAQSPPKGDSYLNPVKLKINTTKSISRVEYASLEDDALETSTCDGTDSATHSVWFKFTAPQFVILDFDAIGTSYETGLGYYDDAVMTVYRLQAGALNEIACEAGFAPRILGQSVTAGEYLVRIAYVGTYLIQGPSSARLSIRGRELSGLNADAAFIAHPLGVVWKAKKAGSPPAVTRECAPTCVVHFTGRANARLEQKVTLPTKFVKLKAGDLVGMSIGVNTMTADTTVRLQLKVTYSDGTPKTVKNYDQVLPIAAAGAAGPMHVTLASAAVKNVKMSIISPDDSDIFNLTGATLYMRAGSNVRVLPPPAP